MLLLSLAMAADRVEGSDTLATGHAAVANPLSNAAVSMNPAAIAVIQRYDFTLAGSYGQRGLHWNLAAADSKTSDFVGFGLTYSGDRFNPPLQTWELPGWSVPDQVLTNQKRNHDIGAALAVPLFERRLSIGLGGSVSFYDHERQGEGTAGNLTAGLAMNPAQDLVIGVSARNLLPVPDPNEDRPMEILGGFYLGDVQVGSLSVEGGVRPERDAMLVLGAGGEAAVSEGVRIRGGWRLEDAAHEVTFGGGAGTDKAGVDLGFAIPTASFLKPADWTVCLSVRFEGPDFDAIQPE